MPTHTAASFSRLSASRCQDINIWKNKTSTRHVALHKDDDQSQNRLSMCMLEEAANTLMQHWPLEKKYVVIDWVLFCFETPAGPFQNQQPA